MDDTIPSQRILDGDLGAPVDLDSNDAMEARDVDAERLAVEERGEVEVVVAVLALACGLGVTSGLPVVLVRVERLVDDGVVEQQGLEVVEALLRVEEEGVGAGAELLEGAVRGREDGQALRGGVVLRLLVQTRLLGREEQRRELGREERDQAPGGRWRHEEAIQSVDDSVLSQLHWRQSC